MIRLTLEQTFSLAGQQFAAGAWDHAESLCRQILDVQPGQPDTMNLLGLVAFQRGDIGAAVDCIQKAVAGQPECPPFHSNLSVVLNAAGDFAGAERAACAAVALAPDYLEARFHLALALSAQEKLDEAVAAYREILARAPTSAAAWVDMGNVLKRQGLMEEAMAAYRRGVECSPDDPIAQGVLVQNLRYLPGVTATEIARAEAEWDERFARPLAAIAPPACVSAAPARRLRVGYVSADFRDHVVGLNVLPLLEEHDPAQVEVFCYACGRESDHVTERLRRVAAEWREVAANSDAALADRIRTDGIDILVDLALHSGGNRLGVFARRPAPVQVSFAGYPGASGVSAIEARLSDAALEGVSVEVQEVPGAILLESFWCYAGLATPLEVNALPAFARGHVTFGSLCHPWKVNAAGLALWSRVLTAVPHSQLLLQSPRGSHRENVLALLARHGVESERVRFAEKQPRMRYLELYREIDLVLDTVPYNGHTTSLDAFWMGAPVVTLVGETIVGRAGLSQARSLGLETELVAHTPDDFVRLGAALAGDLARLAELRRTLRDRMQASVLMDAPRFARGVETAYRTLWQRWCASRA